jgi:hypothetical protein
MNTVARMGAAVALMWGVGCASPDWIERTLVTVDVTGTWEGSAARSNSGTFQLSLEQQGSQVKGFIRSTSLCSGGLIIAGQLEGVLAGDRFSFKQTNAFVAGELTVNGDEMTGGASGGCGRFQLTLRRVNASSRPTPLQP